MDGDYHRYGAKMPVWTEITLEDIVLKRNLEP